MTVLTGKEATDLYGEKAKDGAVIITTKNGVISVSPQQPVKTGTVPDYRKRQGAVYAAGGSDRTVDTVPDDLGLIDIRPLITVKKENSVIHGWKNFGENPPLYIVDGKKVKIKGVDKIHFENIQSVSILKDQATTKVYGEKARNGVVIITTKRKNPPLYVVNGREMSSIDMISPGNIQSMTILKDRSAIRLYGEKARNGVAFITTKSFHPGMIQGWKDSGENPPLYIVDGKEMSTIGNISPETIRSMTIVKDQAAVCMVKKPKTALSSSTPKAKRYRFPAR
ncbi:MAG: hypothetical protein LBL24_05315 [Bacteroidales bacterium]|jgi:TonB-dependent SusC/RagA subfamily outer membrane receptor|nr:hypothetical protein [Bacteroidales bacterium]